MRNGKQTCFVIMPFGQNDEEKIRWKKLYDRIFAAAIANSYDCYRVDELPGIITENICQQLQSAELVVAVLTDFNPNVFYELGIRHTLSNNTLLMIDKTQKIPFDTKYINTVQYDGNESELVKVEAVLTDMIGKYYKTGNIKDSIVRKYLPVLGLYQEAGIAAVYPNQDKDPNHNAILRTKIEKAVSIKIIQTTGKNLLENFMLQFREAIIKGAVIQILIAQKDSSFLTDVADIEIKAGQRSTNINKELEYIHNNIMPEINSVNDKIGRIEMRFYRTEFRTGMILTRDGLDETWGWITMALPPIKSKETTSFEITENRDAKKEETMYYQCEKHFDELWKASEHNQSEYTLK
jgi:hypothetical protein